MALMGLFLVVLVVLALTVLAILSLSMRNGNEYEEHFYSPAEKTVDIRRELHYPEGGHSANRARGDDVTGLSGNALPQARDAE
jgi:cell division protein FtsX